MRSYQYIPFPELRRQYERRLKLRRMQADFFMATVISAAYGIMTGLMLAGVWVEF